MGGCAEFSVKQTGDATLTKSNVTATIVPIGSHETCAGGNGDVQVVVAEATTALGGALDLYFAGEVIRFVAGHARDLEALLSELVPGVEVTKHDHADAPYGVAFAVTFPPAAGRRPARGGRVQAHGRRRDGEPRYPVVNVSTMADARDMAGAFRLSVGGQETGDIRWGATHGKVLAELHARRRRARGDARRGRRRALAPGLPAERHGGLRRGLRGRVDGRRGRRPPAAVERHGRVGQRRGAHAPHHGRDLLPAHQGPAPLRAGQPDAGPRPPQRRGGGRRHGLRALDALRAVGPVPRRRPAPPRAPVRPERGRDAGGGRAGPLPGLHRVDDALAAPRCRAA